MTAKSYLQQVYWLYSNIKIKSQQLDELRADTMGYKAIDYAADNVQTSPSDRMANTVGRYADLEAVVRGMIDEYYYKKDYIINQITALDNAKYVEILYARYVEFKSLKKIAHEMSYEYKWACALHGRALKAFSDKYLNNTNKHD